MSAVSAVPRPAPPPVPSAEAKRKTNITLPKPAVRVPVPKEPEPMEEPPPRSLRSTDFPPADGPAAPPPPPPLPVAERVPLARPSGKPPSGRGRRGASLKPPSSGRPQSREEAALAFDGFDEGSIAFAFDALVSEDGPGAPGTHDFDLAPVRELFGELAANHMRHVRDFMIDVKWGEVTRDWVAICVPPVRTLRRAAEKLELSELATALDTLGAELASADAAGGHLLGASEKQRLLAAYEELVKLLPSAFSLDRDQTQREAVIVQALLLQVPDVRKVTIDKLHAAGLTSLTALFDANAVDIANVAAIPESLAERIVARVQAYRTELQSSSPQDARAAEREKLAVLNTQLKQHHAAYEAAANGWDADAKARKRDHFRAREEIWLEISVLLARFGEVDRLQGIEKVPFAQRIAQLSEYLKGAGDRYRAPEE